MDRQCVKCLEHKPSTEFSKHKSSADGIRIACRSCSNTSTRLWKVGKNQHIRRTEQAWRLANPERTEYLNRRGNLRKYNLTVEQYDDMLISQNYRCALCLTDKPGGRGRFHVDHDHGCCPGTANSCGKCVRGLLCHRCNVMIAHAQDSVERLADAIVYLLDWENSNV